MKDEADRILQLFRDNNVAYQLYEHPPVYTSEEAAKVRGVELKTGCKSMVLKKKSGGFVLANVAADRKIDFKVLEACLCTKLAFASKEEVLKATNCESGSVPPFGKLFGMQTFLDPSVLENEFVNFNIGLLTRSVKISRDDLVRLMEPTILKFAK